MSGYVLNFNSDVINWSINQNPFLVDDVADSRFLGQGAYISATQV